jgi:hypothetical protein
MRPSNPANSRKVAVTAVGARHRPRRRHAGATRLVAYPMATSAAQMHALHAALSHWEGTLGIAVGTTEILHVCETALGVVDARSIAGGSPCIRAALLGTEDLAADLCAERHPDATELDHARRGFLLECRAAGIEPIDAPYTFSDTEGAVREAKYARRLGYRCKSDTTGKAGGLFCEPLKGAGSQRLKAQCPMLRRLASLKMLTDAIAPEQPRPGLACVPTQISRPHHTVKPARVPRHSRGLAV